MTLNRRNYVRITTGHLKMSLTIYTYVKTYTGVIKLLEMKFRFYRDV